MGKLRETDVSCQSKERTSDAGFSISAHPSGIKSNHEHRLHVSPTGRGWRIRSRRRWATRTTKERRHAIWYYSIIHSLTRSHVHTMPLSPFVSRTHSRLGNGRVLLSMWMYRACWKFLWFGGSSGGGLSEGLRNCTQRKWLSFRKVTNVLCCRDREKN